MTDTVSLPDELVEPYTSPPMADEQLRRGLQAVTKTTGRTALRRAGRSGPSA